MITDETSPPAPKRRIDYISIVIPLLFFAFLFYARNTQLFSVGIFMLIVTFFFIFLFLGQRLEALILIILIGTSTVFFDDFHAIYIGIGDLYIYDLLVIALLLGCLLKNVTVPTTIIARPLGYAFVLLISTALFSSLYSLFVLDANVTHTGLAFRGIFYYSLFFLTFFYIKNPRQLNTVLLGIGVLGVAVSLLIVVQNFLGFEVVIISGRLEYLRGNEGDPLRALPPGTLTMALTFNTLMAIVMLYKLSSKQLLISTLTLSILLLGIIFTFTRSLWVALFISAFIVIIAKYRARSRSKSLLKLAFLATIIFISVFLFFKFTPGSATLKKSVLSRTLSIFQAKENFSNDTLYIRYVESRVAWETVKQHPLFGIGLGVPFNSLDSFDPFGERLMNIGDIHNGYLTYQLRMGIVGTAALLCLLGIYFYRAIKLWKRVQDTIYRLVVIGTIASMAAILFLNLFGSPFYTVQTTTIIAVAMAVTEKIFQFENLT